MNRRAFTLPEILVTLVLTLVLVAVLAVIYVTALNGLAVVNNLAALTSQFQITAEQLERDLHGAEQRMTGTCGAFNSATDLILEAPGIGGAGVDRVVYTRTASGLERLLFDATCATQASRRVLARDAVTVTFAGSSTGQAVIIRLLLQNQFAPAITSTLVVRYRLRN